jgi:hypothetical protein
MGIKPSAGSSGLLKAAKNQAAAKHAAAPRLPAAVLMIVSDVDRPAYSFTSICSLSTMSASF